MLDIGIIERIVLDYRDIYKQALEDNLQSPAELPYFEGDFWPNVMEENIRELEQVRVVQDCQVLIVLCYWWLYLLNALLSNHEKKRPLIYVNFFFLISFRRKRLERKSRKNKRDKLPPKQRPLTLKRTKTPTILKPLVPTAKKGARKRTKRKRNPPIVTPKRRILPPIPAI